MLRRLELLRVTPEDNRHVPTEQFDMWRARSLRAHNVGALACASKVALSIAWFYFCGVYFEGRRLGLALVVGGLSLFLAWAGVMVWGWRESTEARAMRTALQINAGRKPSSQTPPS